jgi:hypothetical protein
MATQQIELVFPEPGDVGEGLGSRQHRQQRQQQHLIEGIDDLDQLPGVRQIRKMLQKNHRLEDRFLVRRHRPLSQPNQLGITDSPPRRFVTR